MPYVGMTPSGRGDFPLSRHTNAPAKVPGYIIDPI
jgi:hypothetical protein